MSFKGRLPRLLAALAVTAVALATASSAAPGELDVRFGTGGKVLSDFGSYGDFSKAAALQADGKIVVVGFTQPINTYTAFKLARYTTSGALDQEFGAGGSVTTDFDGLPGDFDQARDVALQADGKIVVVGSTDGSGRTKLAVIRYMTDGSLDTSFGSDGTIALDYFGIESWGTGIAIQADGKIIVAGTFRAGSGSDFAVARLTPSGSLDPTFGTGGWSTAAFGADDVLSEVMIQADGKIIVTGYSSSPGLMFALARFTADGALDATFGADGTVTSSLGQVSYGATLAPDGKILMAGNLADWKFGVVRYTSNGAPDTSFGVGGVATTDFGGREAYANAVAVRPHGQIVVVGSWRANKDVDDFLLDFAVAQYTSDGSADPSFSQDGKLVTSFTGGYAEASSVLIQTDGMIVAVGTGGFIAPSPSNLDFALARYQTASGSDTTPPQITLPGDVIANATSPTGTRVTFSVTAADDTDPNPTVTCNPPSGSLFTIGTTAVFCSSTDVAGNIANAHFGVRVKGAMEQLADLGHAATGVGPGTSLADKVWQAEAYLKQHDTAGTCAILNVFINQVSAQSGKHVPLSTAASLIADGTRIRAVLGC